MRPQERWEPGDTVVIREIWHGRVFAARPVNAVRDEADLQMFYRPPRSPLGHAVDPAGRLLRIPDRDWKLEPTTGSTYGVLSFAFRDMPYAVLMVREGGIFRGWYVNLQEPLRRTAIGFDTVDHALDVLIPPEGGDWDLKDEDELAEAVRLGLFTSDEAASFFRWAERAAAHVLNREPPFDRDWTEWSPDPTWPEPELPAGWDVASAVSPA